MTKVFVSTIEFHGYHGVTAQERRDGHPMLLDIEAIVTEEAWSSDDVADTVDYGSLAVEAVALLTNRPFHTLERAVDTAGTQLLIAFPRIQQLTLRLAKLAPPIPLKARCTGVERTFTRA